MVTAVAEPVLLGAQSPRIEVIPDGDEHPRWDEIEGFIDALGIVLDPWQRRVLWASLLRRGSMWAAFTVAVCGPRQNGKNGVLEPRELVGVRMLGEKLLIHSAHLADTSKEAFRRLDDLIDENSWLSKDVKHIWRTNGHEAIEFRGGNRIRYRTRTRGGGRGFAGSPVILDEAMFLPEVSLGAIMPVLAAQPDPQVWYTGSAVDQTIHEDGVAFARVRERALEGSDDRLAYFEWSLDAEEPSQVTEEDAADPASWAATNPALGIRITKDYIRAERRELAARTFAVERLGVGDWPSTDEAESSEIAFEDWASLVDISSSMLDPVCLAFDVSPERSAAIAAAGRRADGKLHVEIVEHRAGTKWLPGRLADLQEEHEIEVICCDEYGPVASVVEKVREAGVLVESLAVKEHTQACGQLVDLVTEAGLHHLGSLELASAVKGAKTRPLGDAWAWSRKASSVDISPLVAATLAVSKAALLPDDGSDIDIY